MAFKGIGLSLMSWSSDPELVLVTPQGAPSMISAQLVTLCQVPDRGKPPERAVVVPTASLIPAPPACPLDTPTAQAAMPAFRSPEIPAAGKGSRRNRPDYRSRLYRLGRSSCPDSLVRRFQRYLLQRRIGDVGRFYPCNGAFYHKDFWNAILFDRSPQSSSVTTSRLAGLGDPLLVPPVRAKGTTPGAGARRFQWALV